MEATAVSNHVTRINSVLSGVKRGRGRPDQQIATRAQTCVIRSVWICSNEERHEASMKVISSPGARGQRAARRISKPQMEKRRRERINHSLETLRVLMLESTHNEKLKNPKVEKAEILESVVDFLKAEKDVQKDHQASKRALSVEQRPACACQSSYHDGMRTCLLRVNQFIASKSQEAGEPSGAAVRASFTLPEIPMHPTTPGHIHQSLIPPSPATAAALPPHPLPFHHPQLSHHYLKQTAGFHGATSNLSPAGVGHIPDPLWRPWPQ